MSFDPTRGREQKGCRPALVLSKYSYNNLSELALVCPITSTSSTYPFVVVIDTPKVKGTILSDHVRSMSWKERKTIFICKCPPEVLQEVSGKLSILIQNA